MRRTDATEVKITTQVSEECWIELKVYAVRRKVSLAMAAQEILERSVSKRLKQNDGSNITEG